MLLVGISGASNEFRLTIETHVLGKGLGQQDIMALFNEVAHSPGIPIDVSTGKALIGHVEEHKQVSFLYVAQEMGRGKKQNADRENPSAM